MSSFSGYRGLQKNNQSFRLFCQAFNSNMLPDTYRELVTDALGGLGIGNEESLYSAVIDVINERPSSSLSGDFFEKIMQDYNNNENEVGVLYLKILGALAVLHFVNSRADRGKLYTAVKLATDSFLCDVLQNNINEIQNYLNKDDYDDVMTIREETNRLNQIIKNRNGNKRSTWGRDTSGANWGSKQDSWGSNSNNNESNGWLDGGHYADNDRKNQLDHSNKSNETESWINESTSFGDEGGWHHISKNDGGHTMENFDEPHEGSNKYPNGGWDKSPETQFTNSDKTLTSKLTTEAIKMMADDWKALDEITSDLSTNQGEDEDLTEQEISKITTPPVFTVIVGDNEIDHCQGIEECSVLNAATIAYREYVNNGSGRGVVSVVHKEGITLSLGEKDIEYLKAVKTFFETEKSYHDPDTDSRHHCDSLPYLVSGIKMIKNGMIRNLLLKRIEDEFNIFLIIRCGLRVMLNDITKGYASQMSTIRSGIRNGMDDGTMHYSHEITINALEEFEKDIVDKYISYITNQDFAEIEESSSMFVGDLFVTAHLPMSTDEMGISLSAKTPQLVTEINSPDMFYIINRIHSDSISASTTNDDRPIIDKFNIINDSGEVITVYKTDLFSETPVYELYTINNRQLMMQWA